MSIRPEVFEESSGQSSTIATFSSGLRAKGQRTREINTCSNMVIPMTRYALHCPECSQKILVDRSVYTAILTAGCPACANAISRTHFRPIGAD